MKLKSQNFCIVVSADRSVPKIVDILTKVDSSGFEEKSLVDSSWLGLDLLGIPKP